ncbi:hypothetical protein TREMEDRAFT_29592 [Tremella mesenterica DSM 1558]|uniref:uncharacterized protein n=1 Tax=Tremella mesenterica (strain ATCC 24925 / CBS 8224 / DSM 1558 / NBRC 9311 / NRRL Y-6157 / RJB 2259-6 / UBC 559-6) TaxID=578456 RepID=UPI0003F48BF8|nr:uncharacterized protein TREMEDRAFT_29592 [Tremella mesenterica DSM 1558]EIW69939.1 hypothetical protein TREMEDRAFT_29592 [Tremella mesenterica DSM 1558]
MRSMHQSILVGIGTVLLDDPRLQINLLPPSPTLLPPQPLILDPKLRFPSTAKLQKEWNSRSLRPPGSVCQPWILCGEEVSKERISSAEENGARVIAVSLVDGRIPPQSLPSIMTQLGLSSVMIEGGSRVLSSFLHARRQDGSSLVNKVVVTVAPTFIGNGIGGEEESLPELINLHTETMGKDAVMVCKVR